MTARDAGENWQEFLLKVGNGEANDAKDIVTSVFEEMSLEVYSALRR